MPVADRAKELRGLVIILLSEIQDSKAVYIVGKECRVFHVRMIDRALLTEKTNHLHRIALLPEKMAQIAIGSDLLPCRLAQTQQRARIVDHKVRMHLERNAMNTVLAGKLRRLLPVRDDTLLPLPLKSSPMLRRPIVNNPIRNRVGFRSARTTGETYHRRNLQHACQLNGLAKLLLGLLCFGGVRIQRVVMATQGHDRNPAVIKLLLPGLRLRGVRDQLGAGAMRRSVGSSRAHLHGFNPQADKPVQHLVERKLVKRRIEYTDGQLL